MSFLCFAEQRLPSLASLRTIRFFCFGHPNVDVLLDRYLTRNLSPLKPAENFVPVTEFNRDFADLVLKFEVAKK